MRPIKFRGRDINSNYVYGLLTKKKVRANGSVTWAIATGNCSLAETIPVDESSIAQLVDVDADGNEVYEGDALFDQDGDIFCARLVGVACDQTRFTAIDNDYDGHRLTLKKKGDQS